MAKSIKVSVNKPISPKQRTISASKVKKPIGDPKVGEIWKNRKNSIEALVIDYKAGAVIIVQKGALDKGNLCGVMALKKKFFLKDFFRL